MKNPIIVALDIDDVQGAKQLVKKLAPHVGGFKVGPRLTFRAEKSFLKDLSEEGVLFFDHKFFDIPSTTVASVKIAAEMGAHWVTVHALSGPQCLKELANLEREIRKANKEFRILVVTVLTSFSQQTLPPIWKDQSIQQSVLTLAQSATDQGLSSFVCSAAEVKALKQADSKRFLVIPGIRPQGGSSHDQERTATPREAMDLGASALVIGRPILESKDPIETVKSILETLP